VSFGVNAKPRHSAGSSRSRAEQPFPTARPKNPDTNVEERNHAVRKNSNVGKSNTHSAAGMGIAV